MNSVYPICDYITFYPTTDNITNAATGESTFTIPQNSYSSTAKGQYCLVSLADGCLDEPTVDLPIVVCLKNVNNNGADDAPVGSFQIAAQQGGTTFHHIFVKNDVKYLINARPSQLVVKCFQENLTADAISTGYLTFKFEYLSKEAVKMMNDEREYNVAF